MPSNGKHSFGYLPVYYAILPHLLTEQTQYFLKYAKLVVSWSVVLLPQWCIVYSFKEAYIFNKVILREKVPEYFNLRNADEFPTRTCCRS